MYLHLPFPWHCILQGGISQPSYPPVLHSKANVQVTVQGSRAYCVPLTGTKIRCLSSCHRLFTCRLHSFNGKKCTSVTCICGHLCLTIAWPTHKESDIYPNRQQIGYTHTGNSTGKLWQRGSYICKGSRDFKYQALPFLTFVQV